MTHDEMRKSNADISARGYVTKCAGKTLYINGKMNPEYYRLRKFFMNQPRYFPSGACNFYARSLTKVKIMSLEEFVKNAVDYKDKYLAKREAEDEAKRKAELEERMADPNYKIEMEKRLKAVAYSGVSGQQIRIYPDTVPATSGQ